MAAILEQCGIEVESRRVVPDRTEAIAAALTEARRRSGLVLVTGGIGPTRDDRTREALARALNHPLRHDRAADRSVRAWCRRQGVRCGGAQRRQARLPLGARPIVNRTGSAPGVWYADRSGLVIALPGVFSEMQAMLSALAPRLRRRSGVKLAGATLRSAGRGESRIDRAIAPLSRRFPGVEVTTLAAPGEVVIQLRARGEGAAGRISDFRRAAATRLGEDLVSHSGATLEEAVLRLLRRRRWRLATAESCTAGLVSARVTSVPGSSRVFLGGAVCYNDHAKRRILSVSSEILMKRGAVSRATAVAMARGVAMLTGAEAAIAVTGIAGPGGATPGKPVGTIHWAVLTPAGIRTMNRRLPGDREKVRRHAAALALDLLRRTLVRERRRRLAGPV